MINMIKLLTSAELELACEISKCCSWGMKKKFESVTAGDKGDLYKKISFPGISPVPLVKSEETAFILEGVFPSRELCMVEKNWNIYSLCCLATKILEFQPIHNFTGKPFQLRFLFGLISVRSACSAKWTLKGSWETISLNRHHLRSATVSPLCCHTSWTNHSHYNAEKVTSQILILLELISEISC